MEENRRAKERNRKEMAKRGGEMSGYGRELQREAGAKISRYRN